MTFLLRFWPYLAGTAAVIVVGVFLNRMGYESGYAASEAKWQPLFDAAAVERAKAEARADTQEAQSKILQATRESEHAATVSSIQSRADAAGVRIRDLSLRLAAASARSCPVPEAGASTGTDAGAAEVERRAAEAGASIAAVGRGCELDAARLQFWIDRYQDNVAAGLELDHR